MFARLVALMYLWAQKPKVTKFAFGAWILHFQLIQLKCSAASEILRLALEAEPFVHGNDADGDGPFVGADLLSAQAK